MPTPVYIAALSYYLPDQVLDNTVLTQQFPNWSVEKIATKTGITQRHIAAKGETSADMAVKAAEKLFTEHRIDRSTIDYLILCTQSPDYFLPTTACILQDALHLPTHIGAFDMNLGCSGFVYGLGLAKALIQSKQAKNVLLITSETYSKFMHEKDKSNRTIFGDAAAATLIADEGFARIGDFEYGTDGQGAKNLIVKNGALRNPVSGDPHETEDEYDNIHSDNHLYMNGAEIFQFTLQAVPKLVQNTLEKNRLEQEKVDLFIFHQANKFMLDSLRKKIKIDPNKFYTFMESCGNTVSSTIPIALYEAQKESKILKNQSILLAGFGVGYSWAGCVLTT